MMTLLWSCGSNLETIPVEASSSDQVALESRSEDCGPQGEDCDEPFPFSQTLSGSITQPCQVLVEMMITVCGTEYNFEELSITPTDPNCILTQEDVDAIYDRYIEIYMDLEAIVVDCDVSITTHSNYIKRNCVQLCLSYNGQGEPPTYSTEPCGQLGGCCIERTRWCEVNGDATKIEFFTETISGTCTGDLVNPCLFPGSRDGCISDRCEQ